LRLNGDFYLAFCSRFCLGVIFLRLAASVFASATLDALVNAAERFSTAIGQQLEIVQNAPASAEFVEKTIAYAQAKTVYFWALREAMPELTGAAFITGQDITVDGGYTAQ